MSRLRQLSLSAPARAFADRLLARHPDWEPFVSAYERVDPRDVTSLGSLWLEVPSPHDPALALWAIVQDGEALVGLGHRAAEQVFEWEPGHEDAGIASVIDFVDEVATARVVGAWRRHRFLWHSWETCQFERADDAAANRRVVRISTWPAAVGSVVPEGS